MLLMIPQMVGIRCDPNVVRDARAVVVQSAFVTETPGTKRATFVMHLAARSQTVVTVNKPGGTANVADVVAAYRGRVGGGIGGSKRDAIETIPTWRGRSGPEDCRACLS